MKFRNKSKLFYNYLFSYITILLVPLLILGIFIYTFFLNLLKEEALVNNMNVLYRAQNVIETQLDNLSSVSSQISVNKNLKCFYLKDGIKDAIITINELNNYIVMNSFVEELLYYNRGDDFLYTSTTSSSLPLFLNSVYKYENWQIKDFTNDISNTKYPTYRPMENITLSDGSKKRVLTYIYPISSNNFEFNRTLCFIIPEKSFSTLLNDAVKEYSGVSMILDENNNVITSNSPITFDNHILKESLNFGETNFNKKITIENKKYLFSIVKSEKNNWKYVTFISNYNIMKSVNTTTLIFGIILLFVISIGIAIIYYMMSLNYRPLKKLKLFTQEFSNDDYSKIGEIDAVKNTIEFLNTKNNKLNTQLKNNSNATKDYLLSKVINGKISNIDELSEECANVGLIFDKNFYRIAVLYTKDLNNNHADALINIITGDLLDELTIYAKTQTDNNNIILLISYNEDDTYINERIMILHKKLKEITNQLITFGVGNSTTHLSSISKSYIEAMTALDYRLIKGTDKVIFFDEIHISQFNFNTPVNFMTDKLRASIKEGILITLRILLTIRYAFSKKVIHQSL